MFSKLASLFKNKASTNNSTVAIEKTSQNIISGEDGKQKIAPTTTTIKTYVSGLKIDDRHNNLKILIDELKKEKYYKKLYEGISNAGITSGEFGEFDDESPLYEMSGCGLPHVRLDIIDGSEEISVYVGKYPENEFLVGYLPESDAKRVITRLKSSDLHAIDLRITGGKYKYTDDDEKVKTGTKNYNLQLKLKFIKK